MHVEAQGLTRKRCKDRPAHVDSTTLLTHQSMALGCWWHVSGVRCMLMEEGGMSDPIASSCERVLAHLPFGGDMVGEVLTALIKGRTLE